MRKTADKILLLAVEVNHFVIVDENNEKSRNDDAYQDQLAEAIMKGIRRYFARNPPLAKSKLA